MSQSFTSGDQRSRVSASASVLPQNGLFGSPCSSLQSKGLSRVFSKNHSSKASILQHSAFFIVQLSHPYVITGKTIVLTRQTFVGKVMSLTAFLSSQKNLIRHKKLFFVKYEIFAFQVAYLKGKDTFTICYQNQTKSPINLSPFNSKKTKFKQYQCTFNIKTHHLIKFTSILASYDH